MKVLVLGGTGWLGHRIARLLADKNIDVTIATRGRKQEFAGNVANIKTVVADKNDENAMRELFETRFTHVIDSVPSAEAVALIHKYGAGVRHYLHCSSTGGYAPLPFIPCNETAPYTGFPFQSGWKGKCIVDNLALQLFRENGFPATVIRPCYITGPGKLPLDNFGGRRPDFIPDLIAEKTLDLPDNGEALLQPIHVDDLANSFYLAMMNTRNSVGEVYNICLDHAVTLNRYLEINAGVFGRKPHINYVPLDEMAAKYGDSISELGLRFLASHMCYSIDKAKRDLGYRPSCTPEEAIEETARWAAKEAGCIR